MISSNIVTLLRHDILRAQPKLASVPWVQWLVLPLLLIPILLWLEQRIDLPMSALFFDPQRTSFPWRTHWLTGSIHQWSRWPALLIFLGFVWLARLHRRQENGRECAQAQLVWVSMLLCTVVVNFIKRSANTACTWDLVEFGGRYSHLDWFAAQPLALPPGHCWPGAFSLSGFALIALYFYLYERASYRQAMIVLVSVLLYANALGFVQVMRGAHGLSHQLWTGLFCWYLSLFCYWLCRRSARVPNNRHVPY
jgi:membrane-associated PAP2 superfamily phosphatase